MGLLETANKRNSQRRRRITVGQQDEMHPTAEPKMIEMSALITVAEEAFAEMTPPEVREVEAEGARYSQPKVWRTPVKTVLTHIDATTWKRICASAIEQYLREVSNRQRYGRWALARWEIAREERVHKRYVSLGHDRNTLANLSPGQGALATDRGIQYREQLNYFVVAMQAVDLVDGDETVWKGGFVSNEHSIGSEIAEALRKNNAANVSMQDAIDSERGKTAAAKGDLENAHAEIADLKALVAQALAGLQTQHQELVVPSQPVLETPEPAVATSPETSSEPAPAPEAVLTPETSQEASEETPAPKARKKRTVRRRRKAVKNALEEADKKGDS